MQTGKNARCKTILVKTGYGGSDKEFDVRPDFICENLLEATILIIGTKKMDDVILAQHKGARLWPPKKEVPKSMLPVKKSG
jgi:hypothetical protein